MRVDGERIRQLRFGRGFSQKDLADKADVGQKVVWNMENGAGGHRPSSVLRVAEVLGVSVDDLVVETFPATGTIQSRSGSGPGNHIEIWRQTIYDGDPDSGGTVEKTDEVLLERLGDHAVRATICRKDPPTGGRVRVPGTSYGRHDLRILLANKGSGQQWSLVDAGDGAPCGVLPGFLREDPPGYLEQRHRYLVDSQHCPRLDL